MSTSSAAEKSHIEDAGLLRCPGASKHRARARNLSTSSLSSARPCSLFRPHSACSWVCVVYEWFLLEEWKGVGLLLLQSCAELSERAANQSSQEGCCAQSARGSSWTRRCCSRQRKPLVSRRNEPLCALWDNTNNAIHSNRVCLDRFSKNCWSKNVFKP